MLRLRAMHLSVVILLLGVMAGIGGCAPRNGTVSPTIPSSAAPATSPNASGDAPEWPFWPTRMRLHPLTRLVDDPETAGVVIECRVEFNDAADHTSKAAGQLTLQVYPDSLTPTGAGAVETWNQDLRDPVLNRRQYDDVTRTYLFRLQTTAALPPNAELRAFFLSADGRRLNADMRLRR